MGGEIMARLFLLWMLAAAAMPGQQGARQRFEAQCAMCHGADGAGGERGPSLFRSGLNQAGLRDIIQNGKPAAGMPAFHLPEQAMNELLAYIRTLRPARSMAAERPHPPLKPLPFSSLASPKKGDWPTYHGVLTGNRNSMLDQINRDNVRSLAMRWIYTVPGAQRLEVTPVVVDGVMYVTNVNAAYAIDATNGQPLWHYQRPRTAGLVGDAAGGINRGVAVLGDSVFLVTDHAHLLCLDRRTGKLRWDTEMADYRQHYGSTSAPLVVGDLVVAGVSGGDEGIRGFVAAFHADTGKEAWRFWSMPKPGEPLSETWVGRAIEHGCTATWLTGTYDTSTGLLYWTTGNPCPDYNGDERKGDNLYSDSVLALDGKSGKLKWYFQYTPHDLHDWDAQQTAMLVDANFGGQPRKLLLQANRNGFFYVLDRISGKFLMAKPFVHKLTWASGIGPDGRPRVLPGSEPTAEGVQVCPAVEGATNWMSTAYHPGTGLFYVMALERCSIYSKSPEWWKQGESFYGGATRRVPDEKPQKFLRAIDIQTGTVKWELPQDGSGVTWGGALSTAGGLVFFASDDTGFSAADAGNGKLLWHFAANQYWRASPMTYSVAGRQYVAVAGGPNILVFALPDAR